MAYLDEYIAEDGSEWEGVDSDDLLIGLTDEDGTQILAPQSQAVVDAAVEAYNNNVYSDGTSAHPDARLVRLRTKGGQATDFFRFSAITWGALRPDSAEFGTATDYHEAFQDQTVAAAGEAAFEHVYVAAYPLSLSNGEVVSQPGKEPLTALNLDEAIDACNYTQIVGFGDLHRLWSIWDRSLVVNHCMHAGYQPIGNTSYGVNHDDPAITGIYESGAGITLAGSMGSATSHNGTAHGVYDLVGNVWEWCYGLETVDGQLKWVQDNRSFEANRNKPILKNYWLSHVTADGSVEIVTDAADQVQNGPSGSSSIAGPSGFNSFNTSTTLGLRRAIIVPISDAINPSGAVWSKTYGDNALLVGGAWNTADYAGLAALNIQTPPLRHSGMIGFRSAFAV